MEEAKRASRIDLIRSLAALHDAPGSLDRMEQVLRLVVYVSSVDDFTEFSSVAEPLLPAVSGNYFRLPFQPLDGNRTVAPVVTTQIGFRGDCLEV
ncbi:hypothetical protein [Rhizobium sp. Leaf341]|uniref:hypothetical protein n=1 Tax=Rhizobium sp. Leaf341 TaxID=1736344 RepID=UPI000712D8E0|nr:hypothetical protein [Rhizobium sp. Leaf341]KQR71532.1 hypothetical protein ASG03_03330 [Rhizobium sp. Leaf341]